SRLAPASERHYDLSVPGREKRGCMRVDFRLDDARVLHVFNVHLGTSMAERRGAGGERRRGVGDQPPAHRPPRRLRRLTHAAAAPTARHAAGGSPWATQTTGGRSGLRGSWPPASTAWTSAPTCAGGGPTPASSRSRTSTTSTSTTAWSWRASSSIAPGGRWWL